MYTVSGSRNYKTFKPKKHIDESSHQFELMKYAMQTLGSGNLRLAVALPEGEDLNEWVAVNSKSYEQCLVCLVQTQVHLCKEAQVMSLFSCQ